MVREARAYGRICYVCNGSRLCENAKAINCDRTIYSFKIVSGAHIARAFGFEIERKNIILVALRIFEFSHRLGPEADSCMATLGALFDQSACAISPRFWLGDHLDLGSTGCFSRAWRPPCNRR